MVNNFRRESEPADQSGSQEGEDREIIEGEAEKAVEIAQCEPTRFGGGIVHGVRRLNFGGMPFVMGDKDGRVTLTFHDDQHEYVFIETKQLPVGKKLFMKAEFILVGF